MGTTTLDLDKLERLLEEEKRLALAFSGRKRGDDVHPEEYHSWLDAMTRAKHAAFLALPALIAAAQEAEQRGARLREALEKAREHVWIDDGEHDIDDPDEGLVHDPESCWRCRRDETLIAIDAALAEGQDGR